MQRADYSYTLQRLMGQGFIVIIDKDLGHKSVTNDIDNIVPEIVINDERIDNLADWKVIYWDSNGEWWGYNPETDKFIDLYTKETEQEAMSSYLHLIKNKDTSKTIVENYLKSTANDSKFL